MKKDPVSTADSGAGAWTHRRRMARATGVIALMALVTAYGVMPVLRGALQSHFGLSSTFFGFLINFGSLAGAAGALASGSLIRRMGAWNLFRLSLAGAVAGYAWAAIPGGPWMMTLTLGVIQFFYYVMAVSAQAALVTLFPEHRRRVITAYLVGASLMGMLLPLVGEGMLRLVSLGWLTFGTALHGLFGLTALLIWAGHHWLHRQPDPSPLSLGHGGSAAADGRVAGLWVLVALAALHIGNDTMAATWIPIVLAGPSYVSHLILPGLVTACFSLGYLVSRVGLGFLPENRWRKRLIVAPGLAGGLVLLAGLLTRSQAGAAVGYALGGFCWSVEYPVAVAAMAGDHRFGKAIAIMNVVGGVLAFILPTVQGGVVDLLEGAGRGNLAWIVLLAPALGFMVNGVLGAIWVRRYVR